MASSSPSPFPNTNTGSDAKPGAVHLFSPKDHSHLIPYIAALHAQCITHDRTIATFLPPLSQEKLLGWWKERIAEVSAGTRLILLLLDQPDPNAKPKGTELMGVVMLAMPVSETGAGRGKMEKLLVHTKFRGRGGARALVGRLEEEAKKNGRTLLLTDTETGSPAEEMYRKFGFVELGKIPRYGVGPDSEPGQLCDETFFYKHLS